MSTQSSKTASTRLTRSSSKSTAVSYTTISASSCVWDNSVIFLLTEKVLAQTNRENNALRYFDSVYNVFYRDIKNEYTNSKHDLESKKAKYEETISDLKSELNNKNEEIEDLKSDLKEKQDEIDDFNKNIQEYKEEVKKNFEIQTNDMKEELEALKLDKTSLNQRISQLEESEANNLIKIEELNETVNQLNETVNQLNDSKRDNLERINELEQEIWNKNQEIRQTQDNLEESKER